MCAGKEKETEVVFNHHQQATSARDLDAIMEDYAEDSIVFVNAAPEPLRGLAAIRSFLAQLYEVYTPEVQSAAKIARQDVEGEIVYTVWSAGPTMPFGTETYVIRDGKIRVQTATAQMGH